MEPEKGSMLVFVKKLDLKSEVHNTAVRKLGIWAKGSPDTGKVKEHSTKAVAEAIG